MTAAGFFANAYVQTTILALITAFIGAIITAKPRLVWSQENLHYFKMEQAEGQPILIQTSEIWLKNNGRSSAKNLEVVLNYVPQHFEIWRPRRYTEKLLPDKTLSLVFEELGPKDDITIAILDSISEIPKVVAVRHNMGTASKVEMQTQIKPSLPLLASATILMILGALFLLYQSVLLFGPYVFLIK